MLKPVLPGLPLATPLVIYCFSGPSSVTDTACSSSIYALNEALKSIRCGDCDAAVVGGAMLGLSAGLAFRFFQLGMLSSDGMCKAFDKNGTYFRIWMPIS